MSITVYPDLPQGGSDWLQARAGIITASTIGKLISPKTLKPADSEVSRRFLRELAVERITGQPTEQHETYAMRRGTAAEPWARELYEQHYSPVTQVGFIRHEFPGLTLGVSPDGLIGDELMLEIKSPGKDVHFQTIRNDQVPAWNLAQVHAAMLIADRGYIDFCSYCPSDPGFESMRLYVKRVERNETWDRLLIDTAAEAEEQIEKLIAEYWQAAEGRPETPSIDVMAEEEILI